MGARMSPGAASRTPDFPSRWVMAGSLVLQEKKISQGCHFHGYSKMNISLLFLLTLGFLHRRKPKDRSCKLAKSCMLWVQHWPRPEMLTFQLKSFNLLKNSSRHVLKATSGEHKNVFCKSGFVFPLRISKQHKNHEATFDLFLSNTTCLQCCPLPAALFKHWQNKFRLFPSKAVQTRIKLTGFRPD